MPSLLDLPAELRQHILFMALPETHRVESAPPTQFTHLFHINRRLRFDMTAAAPLWTPIHSISHPTSLTGCLPRTRGWNCRLICLDLFWTSFLGRIVNKHTHRGAASFLHPELLEDWINAVPFLPDGVAQIWLDVTPAPGNKREMHPEWRCCGPPWLDLFVHGDAAARRFLGGHVRDVAALVRALDERYEGRAKIRLCGRLSEKSRFFVEAVGQEIGGEVEFVGSWVENEDALKASVESWATCPMVAKEGQCGAHSNAFAWLAGVDWSRETGGVYTELADKGVEVFCRESLKDVARFYDSEDECVVLAPSASRRDLVRIFQHQIAADLGLKTREAGEGDDRHVFVRR